MTSRLIRVAIAGACVLGGTCFWFGSPLKAQTDEDFGSFREAYSERPTSEQKTVRLRYLGATWDRVLKDFAKQTGRELVMDAYPQGRVTRRDGTAYTVPEALRLLNSELENDGYRLLLQREHIVVLKLDNARSRYSRPVASKTSEAPKSKPAPLRSRTTNRPDYEVARKSRPTIRRISGYQQTPRAQAPVEEQTFEIANAKAADVARSIYEVFATRSTLNKSGVRGLPSFTVYHRSENGDVTNREHFEIGIDRANNALTVAAPANSIRQLINLIRELDQAPRELAKQNVKVVETENVKAKTTDELQRELNRMTRGVRTSFSPNRDNMFFAQNSQDGNTPAPSAPQTGSEDPRSMNLQGDVVLQPLDDIGAVVIKGNQADIDTVVGIIEELEELSKGTLPDINLVELKSVNSEALAELLTSVYENLTELREAGTGTGNERKNNIGFVPVVKPNAILVLAPQVEMEAIQNLINKLDRPVNPTYEFEVFQLKHAIASQVVASLTSLTEEPTGLATRIRAVADVRTNSVIVQARPTDLELVAALIQKVDQDKAGKSSRLKVIKLRNAVAEELAETIQTAIQNIINPPQTNVNFGQTGSSELRDSQSVVLEFFTRDGDIERLLRSGILVDVRVQADIRTNSLLVTAPEPSLELMEALIKELDGVPRSVADIKVFTLERADATQAVELLTGLFEDQNNQDETGIAIAGADTAESTLVPLRFSADVRTNTVVAAGSLESLAIVEAILLRLDESRSLMNTRGIEVIQLNNISAETTAAQLAQFLESQAELLDQDALRSGVERLANEVIVDFEIQSNSLIVSATPEWQAKIREVVAKLDMDPRQVVIQALLVEVALDNNDEFGIELGFQDPFNFLRGGVDAATGLLSPGFGFNAANQIGNTNPISPNRVATQSLSNFGLGRQNSDLGFGGFVFSANSEAVNVLIRALQARRSVHVLSRPMINATNGLEASIQVGQEVPVINGFTTTGLGNIQPTVERDDAGVILTVTPRISDDGTIQLSVYAEKSAFNGDGVPLIVDGATGNTIESPIKDVSVAQGDIILRNGQTAVFGGIISKADNTLERKVPWLGDVPLLGRAFRFDATETRRSELLIFLTPRIVKNAADVELIKQIEAERLHYIETDAEEVHGPIFSVPAQGSAAGSGYSPASGGNGFEESYPAEQMLENEPVNPIQPTSATTTRPRTRKKRFGIARPGNLLKRLTDRNDN